MTAPAARGRAVSGAISLPSRGAFHLSLTVLVHYRSQVSIQPWRVVPPDSGRLSRERTYSGIRHMARSPFAYGALTLFRRPFHTVLLDVCFVYHITRCESCKSLNPQPPGGNASPLTRARVWAHLRFRSPLLAQSRLISFPPPT